MEGRGEAGWGAQDRRRHCRAGRPTCHHRHTTAASTGLPLSPGGPRHGGWREACPPWRRHLVHCCSPVPLCRPPLCHVRHTACPHSPRPAHMPLAQPPLNVTLLPAKPSATTQASIYYLPRISAIPCRAPFEMHWAGALISPGLSLCPV